MCRLWSLLLSITLPSGWILQPAPSLTVRTGTMPQGAAASPDGRELAVVESGFNPPALGLYDARTLQRAAGSRCAARSGVRCGSMPGTCSSPARMRKRYSRSIRQPGPSQEFRFRRTRIPLRWLISANGLRWPPMTTATCDSVRYEALRRRGPSYWNASRRGNFQPGRPDALCGRPLRKQRQSD